MCVYFRQFSCQNKRKFLRVLFFAVLDFPNELLSALKKSRAHKTFQSAMPNTKEVLNKLLDGREDRDENAGDSGACNKF